MEKELKRMSRERLLPDEKIHEKVARYEANLSRGLNKAHHELEALQFRRTGGAAPLARRDVDGLARVRPGLPSLHPGPPVLAYEYTITSR